MNFLTVSNITKYMHCGTHFHAVLPQQICLLLQWQKWQWKREPDKALAHVVSALPVISFPSASVCKTSSPLLLTHEAWMATFQTLHYTSATSQCPLERSLFNYNSKAIEKMERMCCTIWEVWSFRATWNRISEVCRVRNLKYVSWYISHDTWNVEFFKMWKDPSNI